MIHTAALLLALFAAPAQAKDPDKVEVSVDLQDATMGQLFEMLTRLSGIPIELDEAAKKAFDLDKEKVSVKLDKISLSGALRLILAPRNMQAAWVDQKKLVVSTKGN